MKTKNPNNNTLKWYVLKKLTLRENILKILILKHIKIRIKDIAIKNNKLEHLVQSISYKMLR